jgi:hypothetical protein
MLGKYQSYRWTKWQNGTVKGCFAASFDCQTAVSHKGNARCGGAGSRRIVLIRLSRIR